MRPTMVSLPERTTLRDWVALNWLGFGDIVEIGTFCGGSAVAIMQGMDMARRSGNLYVYDTFLFPKGGPEDTYRKLVTIKGDTFRPVFDKLMIGWEDRLRVVQGDASQEKWNGNPIEMLHLDCSISAEFHEKVALEFYPHLVHGGTLVHQDFGYEKAPFIAQMMEKLSPWFRRLGSVETTVYFGATEKITREDIEQALRPAVAEAA